MMKNSEKPRLPERRVRKLLFRRIRNPVGALGYVIVALFATSWVVSFFLYQASGYDRRDKRAT